MTEDHLLQQLRKLDLVHHGKVTLKNAGTSDTYIDLRKAYGEPEVLSQLCERLMKDISPHTTCIAGSGHGGIPLASILAVRYHFRLTMVREQPKEHGKETLIDGYVPTRADRVSLVDDVVTTGRSFEHMIKVLKPTGAEILGCHAIVKRGESCVPMTYFFVPGDLA